MSGPANKNETGTLPDATLAVSEDLVIWVVVAMLIATTALLSLAAFG